MSAHAIRNQIVADVIDVWGVSKQYVVDRLIEPTVFPYAVIRLNNIARSFNGIRSVQNEYRFMITFVDKINSETNIEQLKELRAISLISRLEGGATYAGAYLPQVVNVEFSEINHPAEMIYELTLEFVCFVDEVRA